MLTLVSLQVLTQGNCELLIPLSTGKQVVIHTSKMKVKY